MSFVNTLDEAKHVFDIEINALSKMRNYLDETFVDIIDIITSCKGKVITIGMGKPGHIAAKIAATFASLGTSAFHIHPAEAMHGDLGMIASDDVVIAISYSGESDEIVKILPSIKMLGSKIVAITGNKDSSLAKAADVVQVLPPFEEACHLGLAPTSSTTVELCYGDALAIVISELNGFTNSDFGKYHPAGSLGKKLILRTDDLMAKKGEKPTVKIGTPLMKAIEVMSEKGLGVVFTVDDNGKLEGIITDGDLRRTMEKRVDIYSAKVEEAMTRNPLRIKQNMLAVDALLFLKNHSINSLPVVDDDNVVIGAITWQMIVKAGIVA